MWEAAGRWARRGGTLGAAADALGREGGSPSGDAGGRGFWPISPWFTQPKPMISR